MPPPAGLWVVPVPSLARLCELALFKPLTLNSAPPLL
jgi:hypothetical protein